MSSIDKFSDTDRAFKPAPPSKTLTSGGLMKSLQKLRPLLLALGPAAVIAVAGYLYITGGRFASTDDARIETPRTWVSTDIPGRVSEIDVHDNELVQKGQVLFRLRPTQYQFAVALAKAQLGAARLRVEALKASYLERVAELKSAEDAAAYQQRELERDRRLMASGIVSQAQEDLAEHAVQSATQQVSAAQQAIAGALADLGGDANIPLEQHPMVQEAQAVLDKAEFDLSNTIIAAPETGIVSKSEQLQVGDYVTTATPLFSLIPQRVWVDADFKETELTYMRPGQKATVLIDTYPDKKFTATVSSISPGTGSTFSLLPPENATGNWVKVVQRVSVRLSLDDVGADTPLHDGLSATVDVDTGHQRAVPAFLAPLAEVLDPKS